MNQNGIQKMDALVLAPPILLGLAGIAIIAFSLVLIEVQLQVFAFSGGVSCVAAGLFFFNRQLNKIREIRGEYWPC